MAAAAILTAFLAAQAVVTSPEVVAPPVAPSPVELSWDAPTGCPDADTVRDGIARGLPSTEGGLARVHALVTVSPLDAEHWRAALELRGADWTATRTLKGPSCAAVADAAALVIVMALASELQAREVVVEAPPPPPTVEPRRPSSPLLGVGGAVDTSTLSAATPGLAVAIGWRWARARVDLRGAFFREQAGRIEDQAATGADLSLLTASLRGCYVRGDVVSLGPCVAAGLDRLVGRGFGPIASVEASNIAPFFAGGLVAEWRVSRWVVPFLSAEAAIPLVRARFSVKDVGLVHQAAAVSLRGAAGLEVRFR